MLEAGEDVWVGGRLSLVVSYKDVAGGVEEAKVVEGAGEVGELGGCDEVG